MTLFTNNSDLDDTLLDVATSIELSENDRRVAESRYRKLKDHLENPECLLAQYLVEDESRIYAQGSMAIGATIVSGDNDDRFDLDALVEIRVPHNWSPKQALDILHDALKTFPGAKDVIRCTRCVQMQFAHMHMDVTILDPKKRPYIQRAGEIFHSPDSGSSQRIPVNPYGFTQWFREHTPEATVSFSEALGFRRSKYGIDRLEQPDSISLAEQEDLPPILPPRLDSENVVALKLLKRFLYKRYETRKIKRPPSVYLSKLAITAGSSPDGLCAQLRLLADFIKENMDYYINLGRFPDERNPSYDEDRFNDRWPESTNDLHVLLHDMKHLISAIDKAKYSSFTEITNILFDLFGEQISRAAIKTTLERESQAGKNNEGMLYQKGSGKIFIPGTVTPHIIKSSPIPAHNFHCQTIKYKK